MRKNGAKIKYSVWIFSFIILIGCQAKDKNGKLLDTPVSGEIVIAVDEALRPIADAEVKAFTAIYKKAKINVEYSSEASAISKLLDGKVRLAIVSRLLSQEENMVFESQQFKAKSLKIGIDALALVTNRDNPDTTISYEQLVGLLRGEIKQWKQINSRSPLNDIKIIFDNDSAASVRYMKDSIAKVKKLPPNCFAVETNPKVIDYVSQNKDAIGLIGVSWISDRDDTVSRGFLNKINVIAVAKPGEAEYGEYFEPFQAYIAQGSYALTRNIYIISRETRSGLGSGFMAFVAGEKGQRIILKSGLVPTTMPVRIMQFKKN